jgi:hypothetical protein
LLVVIDIRWVITVAVIYIQVTPWIGVLEKIVAQLVKKKIQSVISYPSSLRFNLLSISTSPKWSFPFSVSN